MDIQKAFDERDLIDMMFESTDIDTFKLLWDNDNDAKMERTFAYVLLGAAL